MSGISLNMGGTSGASLGIGFVPPVTSGLLYWGMLGQSAKRTARNMLVGSLPGSIVGTPDYSPAFADFVGGTEYLQTLIQEPLAGTFLAVAKPPSASGNAFAITSFNAGNQANASLYFSNGIPSLGMARVNAGGTSTATLTITGDTTATTEFSFLAARFSETVMHVRDWTHAMENVATPSGTRAAPTRNLRVGGAYSASAGCSVAFAAAYDRVLGDDEVSEIHQRVAALLAPYSIAV